MKTLTLLRHAKSSWNTDGLADHERPLNTRGERDAPEMARRIHAAALRPSLIISSPAVRAWTTAKIVATEISYPLEFLQRDEHLYGASLNTLVDIGAAQEKGVNKRLSDGHNPGLKHFAKYPCPDLTATLPTCGLVSVTVESDTWDFRHYKPTTLDLYDYPKSAR